MGEKLYELYRVCSTNHFDFIFQKEGEKNYITYSLDPERKIIVNIVNQEDENLDSILSKALDELKQLLN